MPRLDEATAARVDTAQQAARVYLAAIQYTRLGFLVRGIRGDNKYGDIPVRQWKQDAYPGPATLADLRFWDWGEATGLWVRMPDDWVVLDHDSDLSLAYWRVRLGPVADKAAVEQSPSGSTHWWFRLTPDATGAHWAPLSRDREAVAFDIRGLRKGGVVAPPSLHHKGGSRRWVRPPSRALRLTKDEAGLLHKHRPQHELLQHLAEPPGRGGYHNWLLSVAGSLARVHQDRPTFEEAMRRVAGQYSGDHDPADTATIVRTIWEAERGSDPDDSPGTSGSPGPADRCPLLADSFWETSTHPFLAHIRQAALYKMRSPDSILHAVLADVALLTHYRYHLPDLGSPATLDLLVGIVANSGDGKGTSVSTADTLVQLDKYEEAGEDDRRIRTRSLGSGEGMAASYFEKVPEEGPDGKEHMVTKRYVIGVRFASAEGAEYAKLAERTGQTTAALIRSVFMGDRIGGTFVGQSRGMQLSPRYYRAVLILQLQPKTVRAILAEREEGTPQRMLWSSPKNPDLPPLEELPGWPGSLDWHPDETDLRRDPAEPQHVVEIQIHSSVIAEIRQELYERATDRSNGEFDGHRTLLREKVAALLGCLRTGKPVIMPDDWRLARLVLDTSDGVRDWAISRLGDIAQQSRDATIGLAADKAGAAELAAQSVRDGVLLVAQRIRRYLGRHPEGAATRTLRDNTKGPHGRDRDVFREALERAEAEGWAEQKDDEQWYAL